MNSYWSFPLQLTFDLFRNMSGIGRSSSLMLRTIPLVCFYRTMTGVCLRLFEYEDSLHGPSARRTLNRPVGRAIDVVGDMHVELDFVRETAIKRHDAQQGSRTWRQNGQD